MWECSFSLQAWRVTGSVMPVVAVGGDIRWGQVSSPRLMRCFSPDRIPGVSMMLILSRTGLGS